jgi:23S rRNA pseudouridine2605 synthase
LIERLQKVIARAGLCSRRAAEELIREGRVTIDGTVAHLGQKIDPETEKVQVDGVPLPVAPDLVYYLLNKPVGVVSTAEDTHARRTVVDLVPAEPRVFPVGRLDQDSTGLIIMTKDLCGAARPDGLTGGGTTTR